jgi:amino acid permease
MSERWKFQLKYGLIWGFMVSFIIAGFDLFEMSFEDAFLSKKNLSRMLLFVVSGIFVVSYFSWKKKIKRESNTGLSHDNPINK